MEDDEGGARFGFIGGVGCEEDDGKGEEVGWGAEGLGHCCAPAHFADDGG